MAAGLGFKTFTTGEVLTAADTNGYLMQGVLVFASSAARASAVTSPQEGQYSYLKDTNSTEYYDGTAWIAAPIGDITGVTAGTGISGGGTSGTVTITNDMATTITAAGDIVVGTGSGTYDNLPIGTTAQVLTADTTVSPYKVKWATPAGGSGSYTRIQTSSYSAVANTGTTFDGVFTSTYNNYVIVISPHLTSSNGSDFNFQNRTSGPTTSTGPYYGSRTVGNTYTAISGTTSFTLMASGIGDSSVTMNFARNATPCSWSYTAFTKNTNVGVVGGGMNDNVGAGVSTGFILSASAGTITGTATVYGLAI